MSGTFSGEGTGYGGTIAVDVTLENGAITGIDVTGKQRNAGHRHGRHRQADSRNH
ncbi:MAG: hypothetical protein ACLUN5_18855 [Oscillospiraceae bacterium]